MQPILDPRSIAIATVLSGLLLAVVLAMVHRDAPEVPGVRSWILAAAGLSIGLGMRQRPMGSDPLPVLLLGNLLLNTGSAMVWRGARQFAQRTAPRWPLLATGAFTLAWCSWFSTGAHSQRARIVAFSILIGAWCFAAAREFARLPERSLTVGRALTAVPLALFGVVLAVRATYVVMQPAAVLVDAPGSATSTDALTYLAASVVLLACMVGIIACVTGIRTAEVRRLAYEDALTGALSRRGLYHALPAWLARHATGASVVVVDLDHFKSVNDMLGHATGDEVLRLFAEACRARLDGTALLARFGGDEFVAVLPPAADAAACLTAIAEEFSRAIARHARIAALEPSPGMSCGTAPLAGADIAAFDAALSAADARLYGEKSHRPSARTPAHAALAAPRAQ